MKADVMADALVDVFRAIAVERWPWLKGDGWPAYSEGKQPHENQTLLVNEVAERLVKALADREVPA